MKTIKFLLITMTISWLMLQSSCLNRYFREPSKEIMNIYFNEMFRNDSVTVVNNGQVLFTKKLETFRGGWTGYFIKVFSLNKKELGFKVRLSNIRVINEPFPDTFIRCSKPLNLEFYINGVRHDSMIHIPQELYLGVDKIEDKDSLLIYWSDSPFQYM